MRIEDLHLSWEDGHDTPIDVFAGFDLRIEPGDVVALVGPSGCGKSTLLRVLAGLTSPDSGQVEVGRCAWMPQRDNLLPWRRVLGNATLGAEVGGMTRAAAQERARPLLERFGLGGYEGAWPSQLSGGMRQRLAVLRTFLIDAPILLLDEPFGALDALTRRRMQSWLQELWSAEGRRTVILVTHDVEEALVLADRVVVLSSCPARIVADLEVGFERPRDDQLITSGAFMTARAELLAALGA